MKSQDRDPGAGMSQDPSLQVMRISPVVPVVVLPHADLAVPLAQALLRGGIGVIEITLRTPAGLEGVRRIAHTVPEMVVGAGTVTTVTQVQEVREAGAAFVVTPGSPAPLLEAVLHAGLPLLAGAGTLTETMSVLARGHRAVKFFPAEAAGGTAYLSALHGPLPEAVFCPTGGVTPSNAPAYLALPNVACVGGSWITPAHVLAARDWATVERSARQAGRLGS